MDSEELRKRRREKILQRSGVKPVEEELEEANEYELALKDKAEIIEFIEGYKAKIYLG